MLASLLKQRQPFLTLTLALCSFPFLFSCGSVYGWVCTWPRHTPTLSRSCNQDTFTCHHAITTTRRRWFARISFQAICVANLTFYPPDHCDSLFFLRCHCECRLALLQVHYTFLLAHQAFLPSKKSSAHSHAPQPQQPSPGTTAQVSMQETLLGRDHVHATPHSHSEADAEASFVIWEHEKEALQSRLSNRREKLFRYVIAAAFAPYVLLLHHFQFCFLYVLLVLPNTFVTQPHPHSWCRWQRHAEVGRWIPS
jgi:hypothetical protein